MGLRSLRDEEGPDGEDPANEGSVMMLLLYRCDDTA